MTVLACRPVPPLQRVALGAAGLAVTVWPAWDLRQAFLSPSLVTPAFGLIVIGAAAIGLTFCAAAVMATGEVWEEVPGGLRRTAHTLLGRRVELIRPADTAAVTLHRSDRDSGPPTVAPVIVLHDGRRLTGPAMGEAAARALADRLRAILRPEA